MNIRVFLKAIVCIALCCTLGSCDLFKTRTPEEPAQVSSNFIQPKEPDLVFSNMENAFNGANSVYYMASFTDTAKSGYFFAFEPTGTARSNYSAEFAEWSRISEERYFLNMCSKLKSGTSPSLDFLTKTLQTATPDSVQYETTYQITLVTQNYGTFQAKGRAQFVLVADRSRDWAIRYWVDFAQSPNDTTWSDLKAIAFTQW